MDQLFGDQLVPHALQDPDAAEAAVNEKLHEEIRTEKVV